MRSYYSGRRARHYNTRWRTFTKGTLAEALALIDESRLRRVPEQLGRPPRAGCCLRDRCPAEKGARSRPRCGSVWGGRECPYAGASARCLGQPASRAAGAG